MIELKFKVGDVLVPTDFRGYGTKITILEVNPSNKVSAYRTSETSDYWWHKDTIESYYELSGEKQPPKFKVGDKLTVNNHDWYPDWHEEALNVEVLEVNHNDEDKMYRTSDAPVRFWSRHIVEDNYYLVYEQKEETVEPEHKFNVDEFDNLLENARKARKAVNEAKLEYIKHQEAYEYAMDAFDNAQLTVNKYVQSKINDGLDS